MNISVSDAKAQLTDLVRRAEEGEEIILTRHGRSVARIGPVKARLSPEERRKIIDEIVKEASGKGLPGPDAAHSQDFLYDEFGLPR
ncbi:MAG: type II toxin-antitoxin system Phd/YefM family antitoxin [Devosia sp.]